ncbi:hypothetical protein [Aliarcobacter butzleri]|uniref:hypothetical protein n=1 Tax=Aliarcobacter butzleri TaxID=28197 RepID=UPI0021B44F37|nr:hypothetical protein [Aliarcobacter butzleri]MCT7568103.1 hypothetical protein [Aliarcobacter butzleri]
MNNKVIIDTNVFYSILGIYENPKISNELLNNYEKYITTVTLYESIIKNRNNSNNIKIITNSIINRDINLIEIGYMPFCNQDIYSLNSLNNLNNLIDDLLNFKIKQESEFARWFFFQIIIITVGVFSKVDEYSFNDKLKNEKFQEEIKTLFESYEFTILDEFKLTLEKAYEEDNTQKLFDELFYSKMKEILSKFIELYYKISDNLTSYNNDKIIKNYLSGINILLSKDKYLDSINEHLNYFIKEFESNFYYGKINNKARRFINAKLKKIFVNKAKFFKNDICDFLNIFAISDDFTILSLDKKYINIIKGVDEKSYNLIKELGYIK